MSCPAHTVRLLHTSDVHIGNGMPAAKASGWPEQALACLDRMVDMIGEHEVDLMLVTGDFFDHNRISAELASLVGNILERAAIPVAVLPGNHDPLTDDSVYLRHRFPSNVHVIRDADGQLIEFSEQGIQVWGQAHVDYSDFAPAGAAPRWTADSARPLWRVAVAHGLYVRSEYETNLSYRIHDHDLCALNAHYVGLGHLEHHEQVGPAGASAYYAGAPDRTGGATLVDLTPNGTTVRRVKYRIA